MIIDGSGDINFPSNEPYNRTETDEPENENNYNPTNRKKKCLIIILVISIIIVLAVGIFLAIYFALKKKENGGSIIVTFEYPDEKSEKIFGEGFNINDEDFEINPVENSRRLLLNMPLIKNRKLAYNEKDFEIGITKLEIKFNKVLTSLEGMFENRKNLVVVDFSELNSKKIININKLFSNCTDLQEVIFNDYDAKKLETMEHTFENCTKLTMLDLSYFSTPKLYSMDSAFKGCTNLFSLNIKNFITNSIKNKNNIIDGCDSLIYVDSPSDDNEFIKTNNTIENIKQCKEEINDEYSCERCESENIKNNISISICLNCPDKYYKSKYILYPIKCEPCLENCRVCKNGYECMECENGYDTYINKNNCSKKYENPSDLQNTDETDREIPKIN